MINIKDMSLSKKLIGGFSIVIILLVIVGITGYNGITGVIHEMDVIGNHVGMADNAMEMQISALKASDAVSEYILGNPDSMSEYRKSVNQFDSILSELQNMGMEGEELRGVEEINRLHGKSEVSAQVLFTAVDESDARQDSAVIDAMEVYDSDRMNLLAALEEFEVMQGAEMSEAEKRADETADNAVILITVISILSGIIGLGTGLYISRSITAPVDEMLEATKKIANGDLGVNIENNSKDEIGELSRAVMAMNDSLKGVISKVIISANKVATSSNELSASSEELKASTDQISNTTQDIASG
ncbi:MAG: HAMP domain-containing protein, partial [Candidatus Methanoperedens sp.]|nr:HAMP domain-containing protein [Candidatus Methanoperedens sp.]